MGEAVHAAGQPEQAIAHHRAALAAAAEGGSTDQQVRAHARLGNCLRTLGNPAQACHHYERALALYTELDAPEAHRIRSALDETLVEC